jgi:hypothetical protein
MGVQVDKVYEDNMAKLTRKLLEISEKPKIPELLTEMQLEGKLLKKKQVDYKVPISIVTDWFQDRIELKI